MGYFNQQLLTNGIVIVKKTSIEFGGDFGLYINGHQSEKDVYKWACGQLECVDEILWSQVSHSCPMFQDSNDHINNKGSIMIGALYFAKHPYNYDNNKCFRLRHTKNIKNKIHDLYGFTPNYSFGLEFKSNNDPFKSVEGYHHLKVELDFDELENDYTFDNDLILIKPNYDDNNFATR